MFIHKFIQDECFPKWRGKPLVPTNSAYRELANLGLSLEDVVKVLEEGREFPRKRKEGVFEKCLDDGCEVINVVVAESFQLATKQEVFVVVHVAKVKK